MSNYTTLLGSYRMSGSTSVMPTAAAASNSHNNTTARPSSACQNQHAQAVIQSYRVQTSQQQVYQADSYQASAGSSSRLVSSAASVTNMHRKIAAPSPSSSYSPAPAAAAASSRPLAAAASSSSSGYSSNNRGSSSSQTNAAGDAYIRNSSSSSSGSNSSSTSSSFLTQAERGTPTKQVSKSQAIIQQANHHKMRSSLYRPKWDPQLRRHPLQHRPLLILDLDETLVHASTHRPQNNRFDVHFNVDMGPNAAPVPVWVGIRPHAREFLFDVAAYFEIAVFTASIKNYADKVCEALDPQGKLIHHRLYRDHCSDVDGVFVKDLSLLNRPMHRLAILDNSPHAYLFHPENSIPILSWFDCPHDRELKKMTPMLIHQLSQSEEVYDILHNYRSSLPATN